MENYIEIPNLPRGRVSLAVVDGRITRDIEEKLDSLNISIIKTRRIVGLYEAIAYHPDVMLHHLGNNKLVVAPNINNELAYELEKHGLQLIIGKTPVGAKYPLDVGYNAARVGNSLICNLKYADEIILENSEKLGINILNVKQGYTKCSICVVDKNALITSDYGIYNAISTTHIDCLLIASGGIELPCMNYGFIGGTSGFISEAEIGFYGDILKHKSFNEINSFIIKYGKKAFNLSKNIIRDFGTLIPLKEYSILTK